MGNTQTKTPESHDGKEMTIEGVMDAESKGVRWI